MANKGNGTVRRNVNNGPMSKGVYGTNKSFTRVASNTNLKQNRQRTKKGTK